MTRSLKYLVLLWALAGMPRPAAAVSDGFRADCAALTRHPHRLAGTPEYRDAADYIAKRLGEIGVDELIVQEFPTAQTQVKRCEAVGPDGRKWPLLPARPDGIIPPVSPPEGITGPLVYVGRGTAEELAGIDPQGKIAVMDYNCETRWLRIFRLGAKAIIFVRNEPAESRHFHYSRSNSNLPRYFYDGPRADLPDGQTVTIYSEIVWERVTGRNVLALIKGTQPVFDLGKEEVVVVSANLDTFGEIPQLTPGARPAANCAALLKLAAALRANRPRRHILLAFFDAQARQHAGAAAFYGALEDKDRRAMVESRLESWQKETDFLAAMDQMARQSNPFAAPAGEIRRELANRLRNRAADRAYEVRAKLMDIREARAETARDSAAYQELERAESELKPIQNRWNDLRRELGRNEVSPRTADLFQTVLEDVRRDIASRQADLRSAERGLRAALALKQLLGNRWIALHIALLLGNNTARWGIIIGGDSEMHSYQDQPGLYGKVQRSFIRAYEALRAQGQAPAHFEIASADGSLRQTRLLWAAPQLVHSGEVAGRHGIYNIVLGTMHEVLPREATPDDTLDRLDLDIMETNTDEIARMLAAVGNLDVRTAEAVADQEGLSLRRAIAADVSYIVPAFENGRAQGALVMGRQRGSSIPNTPVPGAAVMLYLNEPWNRNFWHHNKAYGFDPFYVVISDQNGAYEAGSLPQESTPINGFAAACDARGQVYMASDLESMKTARTRLNMFRCRSGLAMLPPQFWPGEVDVMNAQANASISKPGTQKSFALTTDAVAYWFCEERLEGIKLFGLASTVGLVYDAARRAEAGENYGEGYPLNTDWLTVKQSDRAARDLWQLNEDRLAILRSRDIMNSSLEEMHGRIEDLIEDAAKSDSMVVREALLAAAYRTAGPVYTLIRTSMDDLVKAVLILLALCVPFAFALERLLVGATLIYKQVMWFVVFFTITFIILFLSHPAFAIAKAPVVIFLGFAVVVLSVLVIFIIMQKFQVELKRMQGMTTSVHASDISRFSTVMAAMSLGISTMRRRPLRTALTAITIMLLTFTILCFASFDTQKGIVKLFAAPSPPYTGVNFRIASWNSFNSEFLDVVRGRWDQTAAICPRYWICPEYPDDPDFVVALADGSHPVVLKGILGVGPEELRHRADLRELFQIQEPEDINRLVLMTEAVAELLKVKPGDHVMLKGRQYEVGPLLNSGALSAARDMDGGSILPVDFAAMKAAQKGDKPQTENVLEEQDTWSSLPVDSIVIISSENARLAGGKPHAIPIYTADSQQAVNIAEDLARLLDKSPIIATRQDGVYRHIQSTVVAASGAADLFFPLLLGGLVIFGTMLGSVADREKEIYTFSALGLAPPHVASLFLAEAMVYSVIGGLGGYLVAQGTLKLLSVAASFGLVQVPEMNYSSTNAIVTILIVMATVLVSAIYPAIKASRSANPGLLRSWRLPAPQGDVFALVFPFTVSAYDLTGVVSFLKEHFDNFSDTGLGAFMAREARLVKHTDGSLGLAARLALAPFDLGVTQLFELRSAPSEIKGIDEVNIRLTRLSGQPKDWERLNKVLLDDLRTQFLLWRSLPGATMELYRHRTLATLNEAAPAGATNPA